MSHVYNTFNLPVITKGLLNLVSSFVDITTIVIACVIFVTIVWLIIHTSDENTIKDRMKISSVLDSDADLILRQKDSKPSRIIELVSTCTSFYAVHDANDPTGARLFALFGNKYETTMYRGSVALLMTGSSNNFRDSTTGLPAGIKLSAKNVDILAVESAGYTINNNGLPIRKNRASGNKSTMYVDY